MTSTHEQSDWSSIAGVQALGSREAGYAAARECLRVQAASGSVDSSGRAILAPDAWSWYVGALGEIEVGAMLRALGPQWLIRHAVPIGAGATDVDHLLVGPAGVFVLNTKRHAHGSVWVGDHVLKVNGSNTHHLSAARREAAEAARRLTGKTGFPVPVYSAIVLVGARSLKDIRDPMSRSTAVLRSSDLLRWLEAEPPVLTPTHIELIRLAAEEPQTWHIDPHAADTFRVMARFGRLRDEIGDAPESPYASTKPAVAPTSRRRAASRRPPVRTAPVQTRRPRVVRSRAERIFWTIFLTVVGVPVGLFLVGLFIGIVASVTSH